MSCQEYMFNIIRWIPGKNKWKDFVQLIINKNAIMTTILEMIVMKLVEQCAAITRDDELAPQAFLVVTTGLKDGKASKGSKSPRWNKRDNKDDRKEKDLQKCVHCQ
jgi:hypothetical protein